MDPPAWDEIRVSVRPDVTDLLVTPTRGHFSIGVYGAGVEKRPRDPSQSASPTHSIHSGAAIEKWVYLRIYPGESCLEIRSFPVLGVLVLTPESISRKSGV